jgi:hypothetical protein
VLRSISKPLALFWRSRSALSTSAARFLAALSALILAWSAVGGLMISVIRITYLVKKSAQLLKDEPKPSFNQVPLFVSHTLTSDIVLGLLVGKAVGVFGTTMIVIKLGWAQPPSAASVRQILGISILCGIGFTMSLFIGGLAFAGLDPVYTTQLKIGVLSGSVICGLLGTLLLVQKR